MKLTRQLVVLACGMAALAACNAAAEQRPEAPLRADLSTGAGLRRSVRAIRRFSILPGATQTGRNIPAPRQMK